MIKTTWINKLKNRRSLSNNPNSWKILHPMCTDLVKVYCGRSTGLFKYSFPFRVIYQTRNVAKIMLPVWETFLHENNCCNYNSYKFSYQFTFIILFYFYKKQKQESNLQQLVVWWWKMFRFLILFASSGDLLQRHAKFNRIS